MHCLTTHQTHQVAGAERITVTVNDCLKISEWRQLHADAQREGIMLGGILAAAAGVLTYGAAATLAANPVVGVGIGGSAAALTFMYGYSSGYNNYELWPWK